MTDCRDSGQIKASMLVMTAVLALTGSVCRGADFELWSAVGIRWDPNDDWRFTFQEAFRFDEEGGELYYRHTDAGATYRGFAKWLDVGVRYRGVFGTARDNDGHVEDRPYFQMKMNGDLFGFRVSNRNRIEYRDRKVRDDVWRYRAMFTINEPFERMRPNHRRRFEDKVRPYVSDELFFDLDGGGYNRNRLYGGLSCLLHERIAWNIYYLWQSSSSSGRWEGDLNVLGTTITFLF